ncbi:MAG: hypothetical protein ACLVCT_01650 [Lachnospira sp.]
MSEKLTPSELEKFTKEWLEVTASLSGFINKLKKESEKIKENQS